jgi:putative pyruvate formate lyase activating enzyme
MRCAFCQNYTISQLAMGDDVSCVELAGMMLGLQRRGCHNINLVSPTHYAPQILEAIYIASCQGLHIPVVYNSGGYDSRETLRILEGVIDIYMPDAKYGDDETALILSHAPEYTRYNKAAIIEMQRQVGDLVCENGIAVRGQIIRHLVLPCNLAKTEAVTDFIAKEISIDAYVNIMAQYRPVWQVLDGDSEPLFRLLRRPITMEEYNYAVGCARGSGLHRGFTDSGRC